MKHTVGIERRRLPLQSTGKNTLCTFAVGPDIGIAVPGVTLIAKRLVPVCIKESVSDRFGAISRILIRAVNIGGNFQLGQFEVKRCRIGAEERYHSVVIVAPDRFDSIDSCVEISRIGVACPIRFVPRIEERFIFEFAVTDYDIFILGNRCSA